MQHSDVVYEALWSTWKIKRSIAKSYESYELSYSSTESDQSKRTICVKTPSEICQTQDLCYSTLASYTQLKCPSVSEYNSHHKDGRQHLVAH